jgi:alpha-glucosidase
MRLHDKNHSWTALQHLVPDMLAAGFVGCPFICPDMIGGGEWTAFLPGAPFDPELFIRSAQIHALCPMMQISASPWRVLPAEHQRIFKEVAGIRQKFAQRFVELAKESARTGEPMMRNLEYNFPEMGYAEIKDQFMMGDNLLVAPVIEKGAKSRKVVLPPGKWKADDGRIYDGAATIEVATPLERLPYFELR